jgi:hypothetical protein
MLGAGPAIAQDITAMSLPDSVTTWNAGDWPPKKWLAS